MIDWLTEYSLTSMKPSKDYIRMNTKTLRHNLRYHNTITLSLATSLYYCIVLNKYSCLNKCAPALPDNLHPSFDGIYVKNKWVSTRREHLFSIIRYFTIYVRFEACPESVVSVRGWSLSRWVASHRFYCRVLADGWDMWTWIVWWIPFLHMRVKYFIHMTAELCATILCM